MDPLLGIILFIAIIYALVQVAIPLLTMIIAILLWITTVIRNGLLYLLLLIQRDQIMKKVDKIIKERKH